MPETILIISVALISYWAFFVWRISRKRKRLYEKYGDDKELIERIMSGSVWQGQSTEQLKDSVGHPIAVDSHVLKTKTKEVWKYNRVGKNRFNLRVNVENGWVVGWVSKE